jgi:hypothetical protein
MSSAEKKQLIDSRLLDEKEEVDLTRYSLNDVDVAYSVKIET